MAKRTEEEPFRPLDASLVNSVMAGGTLERQAVTSSTPQTVSQPALQPQSDPNESIIELKRPAAKMQPEASPQPRQVMPQRPQSLTSPSREGTPSPQRGVPFAERMEREKRVLLTLSEERAMDRVVANIGAELGTSLKLSHVLRSCIRLLIHSERELIERARATGRIIRPSNSDLAAIEAFEQLVVNVLQAGIKDSRSIRSQ